MTLTLAEINGYNTTINVLFVINVVVELYLLFNIVFNSDNLSIHFTRTLLFIQVSLFSINARLFAWKPFVILPDVLLVPGGFFKISVLTSQIILILLIVFFCFLVDTLTIIAWERYFSLLTLENNKKVLQYRIIVYSVTFVIDAVSSLGYAYSIFELTGDARTVDDLPAKFTPEINDYLRLRRPNIVYFKDASISVYIDFSLNGLFSFFARAISTYCAIYLLKKYIHGRTLSNYTKNKLKVMTLVVLSQAVVIVLVGIGPTYGIIVAGYFIPRHEYAEEILLICLLIAMQMPLAIACITIYTVKPYQNTLRKVLCMIYSKIFKKSAQQWFFPNAQIASTSLPLTATASPTRSNIPPVTRLC
uniref:Serpentine receptor class gamma n=1 Tax=Panagrellus redivivus TaxID=6233 RepID=A0A7E4V916_PANRE